jgi:hypothetical protein
VCAAATSSIPGIRSVETLPPPIAGDPSFVFGGPLVLPDSQCEIRLTSAEGAAESHTRLTEFLENNQHRLVVYITLGTVLKTNPVCRDLMQHILDARAAIISSVEPPELNTSSSDRFFFAPARPAMTKLIFEIIV